MSKALFEKLNKMSVEEIINEDFQRDGIYEDIERPLSAEETVQYFTQSEGVLTEEEFKTLMYNKMKELWRNEDSNYK